MKWGSKWQRRATLGKVHFALKNGISKGYENFTKSSRLLSVTQSRSKLESSGWWNFDLLIHRPFHQESFVSRGTWVRYCDQWTFTRGFPNEVKIPPKWIGHREAISLQLRWFRRREVKFLAKYFTFQQWNIFYDVVKQIGAEWNSSNFLTGRIRVHTVYFAVYFLSILSNFQDDKLPTSIAFFGTLAIVVECAELFISAFFQLRAKRDNCAEQTVSQLTIKSFEMTRGCPSVPNYMLLRYRIFRAFVKRIDLNFN